MSRADAATDAQLMASALALGRRGLGQTWPNPAVGALVVRPTEDGPLIVGRGWTQPGGRPHAETEALRRAGPAARGATLYVTLEPCSHHGRTPPCADAVVAAGITRVVSALEDPNPQVAGAGHARLRAAGIAVEVGVGAAEARRAHAGHIRRIRDGRPHVTLKLAVSADGKVAGPGGKPIAISGPAAVPRVHLLRAMHDAILVGIGTALADDPLLTCRLPGMGARSPVRVVLDSGLRLSPGARLVAGAADTPLWIFAAEAAPRAAERELQARSAEIFHAPATAGRLDLQTVLRSLGDRGITRLLVEGGPRVAAALIEADLIDEVILLRAPLVVGTDGLDALAGMPLAALARSPRWRQVGSEPLGADILDHFERE